MPVALEHGDRVTVWSDQRRFVLPDRAGCQGRPRLLYSRRYKPQRWEVVGAYCPGCGDVVVATDGDLANGRRSVFD